jgi:lipoate---protein ligase
MTSPNSWQLIPYCVGTGAEQMARDELLLDQHCQNPNPISTLRFYSWLPAAISLGHHQHKIPDRWHELAQDLGMDIVVRPSGGRAVVHKGDLTYAVITGVGDRSRQEMYTYICEFLISGFADLGINLSYGTGGRCYIHNPSCFATATNADLVTENGLKLIGSAQVYRQGIFHRSLLQHGSIQIQCDRPLLNAIFQSDPPIVGVEELLDRKLNYRNLVSKLIETLVRSAERNFSTKF